MLLAVIEFNQLPQPSTTDGSTYVEARLLDPPIDFAIGTGLTVSQAFASLQASVLETAIQSARLLHDDPEEWKRRATDDPTLGLASESTDHERDQP